MFNFLKRTICIEDEPFIKLEERIEELMKENRRLSGALALATDENARTREPVRVHLEIDFKNFKEKKGRSHGAKWKDRSSRC